MHQGNKNVLVRSNVDTLIHSDNQMDNIKATGRKLLTGNLYQKWIVRIL